MKLHTTTWGDGPRHALLVHGLFSDARCWWRLGPDLARRGWTVHAPDLRGHGATGPADRYSPTAWGLDLVDTFHDINFALAAAHSLGGIALAVAAPALRPSQTVYLDPAWRMDALQSARFRGYFLNALGWTDPEQERRELGPRWQGKDLEFAWNALHNTDPAVIPGLANGAGFDHSPEYPVGDVLVLGAEPSEWITPDLAQQLQTRGIQVENTPGPNTHGSATTTTLSSIGFSSAQTNPTGAAVSAGTAPASPAHQISRLASRFHRLCWVRSTRNRPALGPPHAARGRSGLCGAGRGVGRAAAVEDGEP